MRILIGNYIYESQGIPFFEEDVAELLESSNVKTMSALNILLEAANKKGELLDEEAEGAPPDLQPTPEEAEIDNQMKAAQEKAQANNPETQPVEEPETPVETPPEEPETPEEPIPEEAPEDKTVEPEAPSEPESEPSKPEEELPLVPPKDPPALKPDEELPVEDKKPDAWLPSKKLSTLYNNFVDFFEGEKSIRAAGTVIGLKAPGLNQESKYLQCDITAYVQGTEKKPYSVWIKLRRQRATQNWSFDNPCEVRCSCKAFAYYMSFSNVKNKSLAGPPTRNKKYRDSSGKVRTLNFMLPAKTNNPASIPALCKHLALVSKELLDKGMITEK